MKVEIIDLQDNELVMSINDVTDVSGGLCGMILIETPKRNILYKVKDGQEFVNIIKVES